MEKEQLEQKPILVTGAHRSGTTWVGKMLALNGQTAYISEPLNVLHRPGVMRTPTAYWYTYICKDNENYYLPAFRETLTFRYHTWREFKSLRSTKDVMRMLRDWREFSKGRLFQKRPLLKDPFAVFSAEWFAERLGCSIVVVVRHPAAVVNSLTRLGWPFGFKDLLRQPYLMRDWLESYQAEMEKLQTTPDDVIASASLLWRIVYDVVDQMSSRIPDCILVRHEDISLEPVENFRILYDLLGLEFSEGVEQRIFELSKADNPKELSRKTTHSVRLDSRASVANWKHRLSAEDVRRIRGFTEDVAARYYSNEEWL